MQKNMKSSKKRKVTTAVITAGGYGTRFFPFTNVVQKELLPLGKKPIVQHLVEECINAGIKEIIIVTRPNSNLIKNHFTVNSHYKKYLLNAGKGQSLDALSIPSNVTLKFVEEDESIPYGNAQGLLTIREELEQKDCFLVLFGDDIVLGEQASVQSLIDNYENSLCDATIGVQQVSRKEVPNFGNVSFSSENEIQIESIIQKPSPDEIVSDWVIFSQMVLSADIFSYISVERKGSEPDLGMALNNLAKVGLVTATKVLGKWVTVGSPDKYALANVEYLVRNGVLAKSAIMQLLNEI